MDDLGLVAELLTTMRNLKLYVLDQLGPLAPMVTGTGQIITAAVSIFLIFTGKGFWAPNTPGLRAYAARIAGVIAGVGLVVLYVWSKNVPGPNFTLYAIYLVAIGLVGALIYLFLRLTLCFHCECDKALYVRGFALNASAKRVLIGDLDNLPPQYDLHGQPPPKNTKEYFCKSGKDPEHVWQQWSHALAQVFLLVSYLFVLVPMTMGLACASIALTQAQVGVVETSDVTRIDLPTDVFFDFDMADIRRGAEVSLKRVAGMIRMRGVMSARIEGHTDSRGPAQYNQNLSVRRAEAVREWLLKSGDLADVKFSVIGFGASQPTEPNFKADGSDNPEGRQKNRRVVIVIDKRENSRS